MERRTRLAISKLRLPFFKRLKGRGAGASDIADASPDAFFLFDRNLNIIGMNPLERSIFQLILGENLIGEDVRAGVPDVKRYSKDNGRCRKYLNAIRKGKPFFADSIVVHSGLLDINIKVEAFKVGKGFGIIFSELDALKKTEKTQYYSEEGLASNIQNAPDCIFIFDLKGTILHGSRAGEKLTGYAWEEIRGKSFLEIPLLAPEYLPKAAQLLELSASGKPAGPDEFELIRKDGGRVFVDISTCPVGQGDELEIVGIARDITERKKSEEALRQSEEKYRAIVETSLDGIYQVDTSGKFIFVNEAFANTFGYKREELLGKQFSSLLSTGIIPKVAGMVKEVLAGKDVRDEVPVQHKDGHEILVNFSATPLKDCGKIIGLTGILRNISERKHIEKMLLESEARYRALFESSLEGIGISQGSQMVMVNNALLNMLGYENLEELLSPPLLDHIAPAFRQMIRERIEKRKKGESLNSKYECEFLNRKGEVKYFEVSTSEITIDGERYVQSNFRDMTGRKKAEEEIAKSEAKYRSLVEVAGAGVSSIDLKGESVFVNEALCKMIGYSQEELRGRNFIDFLHPDDKNEVLEIFAKGLAGEREQSHLEFRVIHKDGHNIWCYSTPTAIVEGNELIGFSAIIHDITERKRAEQALRESEEKFRKVLDNSLDMVYRLNLQTGRYDYVSPSTERILGYGVEEFADFALEEVRSLAHPDDRARLDENVMELVTSKEGTASSIEYRVKHKNLGYRWVSDSRSVVYDDVNNPVAVVGNLRDVTERQEAEWELWKTRERLQLIFDSVQDGVCVTDLEGLITDVNPKVLEIYRANAQEQLIGRSASELVIREERERATVEMQTALEQGTTGLIEHHAVRTDGSKFLAEITVSLLKDISGEPAGFITMLRDITLRKQMEEAIRLKEARFRSIFENSPLGIVIIGKRGQLININQSMQRILGYTIEELRGMRLDEYMSSADAAADQELFTGLVKGERDRYQVDKRYIQKDGQSVWGRLAVSAVRDIAGRFEFAIAMVEDVTESKKAEEALRDSEERYRALVDTAGLAGEGIMIVERVEGNKAVIAFVNDTLSSMLGYQREEMTGMPARDLFLPGDRLWLQDKHRRRRKGEALPSHSVVVALCKDGAMLPIEISMGSMGYHGKSATVVYVRDVSERKKAEEALRESEVQFRAIFDGAAIGVGLLGIDGQPFRINPALREMLGYTIEELCNRSLIGYLQPDGAKSDLKLFSELVAGKRDHYQVERRFIKKDGQIAWGRVTLSAVRGLGGKLQFAIGMLEDITDSKLALENLRKSEEYFRALTENALDAIVVINKDGTIKSGIPSVNPPRGYRPEEIIDTNGFSTVHLEDMPKVMGVYNELMQNPGNVVHTQVRVQHKDGSWRVVEAVARNLLDDPAVGGIVVNYRDVTEREQAIEELLKHTKRVETLHAVAQAASQTLELEELWNIALDKVIEVMEAEAGCVYLLDMAEKELVLRTSRGLSDDTISRLEPIKLNDDNVQKLKEGMGGSIPLHNIFEETGLIMTTEVKEKEQIQSFAVAPFAVRGQLSGLIAVGNRSHREFSPGDMDLLRAVGNQIGIGSQNAMLYEEVRALIRETIDAQERERERVCLEVHDGVAQTLVSAFQYLQALEATAPDDAQTKQLLAKASAQVKQAIQESREVINSLQPATLSDLGLVSTLQQELKRLGQETGLRIDFKADAIRLPKDIETGLYRIIHEAVFNARKHANTKRLRVKINSEDERVKVEVRDWGKGFDQAYLDRARRRGTGLFSIRKRAELMQGACEIQSEPGQGTTVRVEIPVSAAEKGSG